MRLQALSPLLILCPTASLHGSGSQSQTSGFPHSPPEHREVTNFCKISGGTHHPFLELWVRWEGDRGGWGGGGLLLWQKEPSSRRGTHCALNCWRGALYHAVLCPLPHYTAALPLPRAPPHLRTAARLACACLFSGLAFYHPVSSYLCPLLKADLFISESLPVLCPSLHLLVNLLHLLSSWHKAFIKAFLIPLNPLG